MKVLVIGGTGLLSTSLVEILADRGDDVTVFNRGITESRIPASVRRLRGDRWDYPAFEAQMKEHRFDAVVDMVAFHPDNAWSLLRAFRGRTKHLVVCSTVCVYGGPLTRLPADESEPLRPVTRYGRNKGEIERLLLESDGEEGTRATVLRPSHTTGEGAVAEGILFDAGLVDRIRRGLPVILHDGGKTKWATAHVSDVARGFAAALLNERAFGRAYHLTSPEHTDWRGIYGALGEAAGRPPEIVDIPADWLSEAAPRRSVAVSCIYRYDSWFDNAKAEADLGFRCEVPLVETFRRQIRWMEETGRLARAEEDPFEDVLIEAYRKGKKPDPAAFRDFNPWGDEPEV